MVVTVGGGVRRLASVTVNCTNCATLLLNAGAPVLTVQTILGHVHIDATLGYARLYDGTVAADYYRAMVDIEAQFSLPENKNVEPMGKAKLLAMGGCAARWDVE